MKRVLLLLVALAVAPLHGQTTTQVNTELPPPVTLANGQANPTAPAVGSFTMFLNGSTWNRWNGAVALLDAPGGDPVTDTTANAVRSLMVDATGAILTFVDATTFDFDTGGGTDTVEAVAIACPASGGAVACSIGNGTDGLLVNLGSNNDVTFTSWSALNATAADGATACTNSAQVVKGSSGTFGGYYINNPNTADSWLHLYNVAAASVTVGTTAPALSFRIPGTSSNSVGANLEITRGVAFSTAISMACTSTANGNGAPSTALEADVFFN